MIGVYEDGRGRLWAATPAAVVPPRHARTVRSSSCAAWTSRATSISASAAIAPARCGRATSTKASATSRANARRRAAAATPAGACSCCTIAATRCGWRRRGRDLWRVRTDAATAAQTTDIVTMRDGLASDAVQALVEDREGNIWLGTPGGLQRLSPQRVTPRRDLGVVRVLEAMPDGTLWLGTAAGLTRFPGSETADVQPADGLPGTVVLALHKGVNGELWVATERGVGDLRQRPLRAAPAAGGREPAAHLRHRDQRRGRVAARLLLPPAPLARRTPAAAGRHPRALPQEPAVVAGGPAGPAVVGRRGRPARRPPGATGPSARGSCRSAASSGCITTRTARCGRAAKRA